MVRDMAMDMDEDDLFFENRRKVMFVVNVLADNDAYSEHMKSNGLDGVHVHDIIDLSRSIFGDGDVSDLEIVKTADQLVREGLLESRGSGIVTNPNPPISVDSEGIVIAIAAVEPKKTKSVANTKPETD